MCVWIEGNYPNDHNKKVNKMETKIVRQQSSIEVSKNSKGYTYTVKGYGDDVADTTAKTGELLAKAKTMVNAMALQEELR